MRLELKQIFKQENITTKLSCILVVMISCVLIFPQNSFANTELIKTKQKIKKLKILEKKEMNKLNKNQLKLENAERQLNNSKQQYTSTQAKLENVEQQYTKAVEDYNIANYQARIRIRQIYKKHTHGVVALLLSSSDINDLLDKIYFQKIITKNDKIIFDEAKARAKRITKLKYDMEMQKAYLARSIDDINSQQRSIKNAISENERYINKLKTDRATYEKAERELAKQSSNLENMISRSSKNNSTTNATGAFMKPINGPITSSFGYRIHPIFKSRSYHSGIDIGGPNGGAVKAANSGKVIYAGWYGGYGKVVILDHGNYNGLPTTTLYAHLSSYNVNIGQYLVKGQVLGREGSTGYSTGPHVHFEVRVKGQPRNPLNYI